MLPVQRCSLLTWDNLSPNMSSKKYLRGELWISRLQSHVSLLRPIVHPFIHSSIPTHINPRGFVRFSRFSLSFRLLVAWYFGLILRLAYLWVNLCLFQFRWLTFQLLTYESTAVSDYWLLLNEILRVKLSFVIMRKDEFDLKIKRTNWIIFFLLALRSYTNFHLLSS